MLWPANSCRFSFPEIWSLCLLYLDEGIWTGCPSVCCVLETVLMQKATPLRDTLWVCLLHSIIALFYLIPSFTMIVFFIWPFSSPFRYVFERVSLDSVSLLRVEQGPGRSLHIRPRDHQRYLLWFSCSLRWQFRSTGTLLFTDVLGTPTSSRVGGWKWVLSVQKHS